MASCEAVGSAIVAMRNADIALIEAERAMAEADWRESDTAVRAADAKIARLELALKERALKDCKRTGRRLAELYEELESSNPLLWRELVREMMKGRSYGGSDVSDIESDDSWDGQRES